MARRFSSMRGASIRKVPISRRRHSVKPGAPRTAGRVKSIARGVARSTWSGVKRIVKSDRFQQLAGDVAIAAVTSALQGTSTSDAVRNVALGAVKGVDPIIPDPIDPAQVALSRQVAEQNRELSLIRAEELSSHRALKDDERALKTALQDDLKIVQTLRDQREDEKALTKAVQTLASHQKRAEVEVRRAVDVLNKDVSGLTEHEAVMAQAVNASFEKLERALSNEKRIMVDEAVELSTEIGSSIGEHVAEIVPVVGPAVASMIDAARGGVQLYKLGRIISEISQMPAGQFDVLPFPPAAREAILSADGAIRLPERIEFLRAHADHLAEVQQELELLLTRDHENKPTFVHRPVSAGELPGIHVLVPAHGISHIVMFSIQSHLHLGEAFTLFVDFHLDVFAVAETYHPCAARIVPSHPVHVHALPPFREAYRSFLRCASRYAESEGAGSDLVDIRKEMFEWALMPVKVAHFPVAGGFQTIVGRMRRIVHDAELQHVLLRGTEEMMRRHVLVYLLYGSTFGRA